mgnify:CR=1 FL=1
MKKDIKHIFWMLLCLFTIVACSDENHEMLITGPEIPELDHEPSIEELVEGINNYPTKFKGDKQQPATTCTAMKVMYMFTSVSMTGCMFLRNGV